MHLFVPQMTAALKLYTVAAGRRRKIQGFLPLRGSHRTGAGRKRLDLDRTRSFLKQPSTAWRYMRLMQVVAPGTDVSSIVKGIPENEFRRLNEFLLSASSRSLAAFGTEPLLKLFSLPVPALLY